MLRRREPLKAVTLSELYKDLERGQGPNQVGRAANAYFENDFPKLTQEMLLEAKKNAEGKLYLGQLGGRVVEGKRLLDGRRNLWLEGGTPIGLGDDRHACLIAGSRAGKGRSVLVGLVA